MSTVERFIVRNLGSLTRRRPSSRVRRCARACKSFTQQNSKIRSTTKTRLRTRTWCVLSVCETLMESVCFRSETNDMNAGLVVEVWCKGFWWDRSLGYYYLPLSEVPYMNEVTRNQCNLNRTEVPHRQSERPHTPSSDTNTRDTNSNTQRAIVTDTVQTTRCIFTLYTETIRFSPSVVFFFLACELRKIRSISCHSMAATSIPSRLAITSLRSQNTSRSVSFRPRNLFHVVRPAIIEGASSCEVRERGLLEPFPRNDLPRNPLRRILLLPSCAPAACVPFDRLRASKTYNSTSSVCTAKRTKTNFGYLARFRRRNNRTRSRHARLRISSSLP